MILDVGNETKILSGYKMAITSPTLLISGPTSQVENVYKCNQCDEVFINKNGFQIHYSEVHEGKKK